MTTLSYVANASTSGIGTTINTTTYHNFGGRPLSQSTESLAQTTIQEAGSFTGLYWRVTTNNISGGASTVNFRDNSVTKNNTMSIPLSATGEFEDTTPHTDTIVAGNKYNYQFVPGDTTHILTVLITRILFNTTTNTATRLATDDGNAITTAVSPTIYYWPPMSTVQFNVTEANAKCRQRLAGTAQNLMVNVSANTRTDTNTFNSRVNGAAGSGPMAISILTTATGFKEDLVHSDTIGVGDDHNFSFALGADGAHSITLRQHAYTFLSAAGYTYCLSAIANGLAPASASAFFYPLSASLLGKAATETTANMKCGEAKKFRELSISLSANSTGAGTFKFRKNSGNGNMVVAVTASTTGYFGDPTNVDFVVATDELNYSYQAGAASGVTIQFMSVWAVKGTNIAMPTETTTITETSPPTRKLIRQPTWLRFPTLYG